MEPEGAPDSEALLVPFAEPVDQGAANTQAGSDFKDGQQALMWSGIGRKLAHHRRTKRRTTISTWCYRIRIGGVRDFSPFHGLQTGATGCDAMEFLRGGFGTRGSQVRILSPRPIQSLVALQFRRGGFSGNRR
jgi:hypothetical protein